MDAASMEEESSDRSIQPASPDEQQSNKKDIQGGSRAHLSVHYTVTPLHFCHRESFCVGGIAGTWCPFWHLPFWLVCAGNTEANKQVKVPEDHDSSSGTENPNKGKNDAKGVTDQVKEKRESSSEQQPEKEGEGQDHL